MSYALPTAATTELNAKHWLAAFTVAAALHAAAFLQWPADDNAGAEAPGVGGISVSIAMTASLAGSEHASPDPSLADDIPATEASITETVEVEEVPVEPVETPPPVQETLVEPVPEPVQEPVVEPTVEPVMTESVPIEEVPVEEVPVEEVPEVVQAIEPPPEEIPTAEPIVEPVTEVVSEAVPQPRPPIRPKVVKPPPPKPSVQPTQTVQPPPTVPPVQPVQQAQPVQAQPVQQAQPLDTQSSAASAAGVVSSGQSDSAPVGKATDLRNSTGGAAVSAPAPNYIARLRLWLERHKDYPKLARRKRMQGVVLLYFRVSRDGQILAQEIREESGHTLLDEAALDMLARAIPLPTFPKDMQGDYLDVVLPVEYSLRGNR